MSTIVVPRNLQEDASGKLKHRFLVDCFLGATDKTEYWNRWLPDSDWVTIIQEVYNIPIDLTFSTSDLNCAIMKDVRLKCMVENYSTANTSGIFRAKHRREVFDRRGKRKQERITCYNVTTPGIVPRKPSGSH